MNREEAFGRLLAIANTLGKKVFEEDKLGIVDKHMSRFSKNPAMVFEKIHTELLEYAPKFGEDEMHLLKMFEEIFVSMDQKGFTNEPLSGKYLHAYHTQQNNLNNMVGVEEASEMLGLTPGTVKNYCAEGKIEAKKIGKTWVIDKSKLNKRMNKLNKYEAIEKVNEILGENAAQEFEEQEERAGINGNTEFLVSNSKGLAVQVEMQLVDDEIVYSINEEWAK